MPPYNKNKRKVIPCKYFAAGKCTKQGCPFLHEKKAAPSAASDVLVAMLRLVFEKNIEVVYSNGILTLNNFKECADLAGVVSSIDFNAVHFCNALSQVIKEKIPSLEYINIDNNGVKTIYHLVKALEKHECHLALKGFSCANNHVSVFDFVKHLGSFPQLVEIVFRGNPVAQESTYRQQIRKGLPALLGLDGDAMERDPLSTPWPLPVTHSEHSLPLLQQIEQQLFSAIANGGTDNVVQLYATNALYTLTLADDAEFATPIGYPKNKKEIPRDFIALRLAQSDTQHNINKGFKSTRVKGGRLDVCTSMKETLYPPRFTVQHHLDPNADLQFVSQGVKQSMAVVTFHGWMEWKHTEQAPSDAPLVRHFDRTLVVQPKEGGTIEISNDFVHLRKQVHPESTLMATNPSRLHAFAQKYQLPDAVVAGVVEAMALLGVPSPEAEMHKTLNAIRRIGVDLFNQCISLAPNNTGDAVKIARTVEHYRVNPAVALDLLSKTGGDIAAVEALVASLDPSVFIAIV